jgi:hypothetical protein
MSRSQRVWVIPLWNYVLQRFVPEVLQLDQRVAPQLLELLLRVLRSARVSSRFNSVLLAGVRRLAVVHLDVIGRIVSVDDGRR